MLGICYLNTTNVLPIQDAGYRYHRMDGSTPVIQRARLMDDFNDNDEIFVFLLTTKVGPLVKLAMVHTSGAESCSVNNASLIKRLPAPSAHCLPHPQRFG